MKMDYVKNFTILSLETHLFFGRIMKEHSLFLMAGFQPVNPSFLRRADRFRRQFEELLWQAVRMSDGVVSGEVLCSGEIVTDFTEDAERSTSRLTGIPIEIGITEAEKHLRAGNMSRDCRTEDRIMRNTVLRLNERSLELLDGLIALKEELLKEVKCCRVFTANYPLLLEHILREARLYRSTIAELNEKGCLAPDNLCRMERFWNQIMMEHALFIRGLLDPTEKDLIMAADDFAGNYQELLEEAKRRDCETFDDLTGRTIEETIKYRDFKTAGTKGILGCEITSIILPLLADHVLREANHYLRILKPGHMVGR